MKNIEALGWYEMDDKVVLMVGHGYTGKPAIMCPYDILICSKDTLKRFHKSLIADHLTKKGWKPLVRLI